MNELSLVEDIGYYPSPVGYGNYFLVPLSFTSPYSAKDSQQVEFAFLSGMLTPGKPTTLIPKFRFTILLAAAVGLQLGYKNIVFAGCDMSGPMHFWDHPSYSSIIQKYLPFDLDHNLSPVHFSNHNSVISCSPQVVNLLRLFCDFASSFFDVQTFVYGYSPLLSSFLPQYE